MAVEADPYRPDRVAGDLPNSLRTFNDAGVLSAADIHAACTLARLTGCTDPDALVVAAFAIRAPRYGHVFAQLDDLADTVTDEDGRIADLDPDVWPRDISVWIRAVADSPMVGAGMPLHLDGARLYLDRYWRYEHHVAAALQRRVRHPAAERPLSLGPTGWAALDQLFDDNPEQLAGAQTALSASLSVIAGGPGTGKTATIATIVAVARSHASGPDGRPVRIAIAAPTGKAAARLGEAMRQSATTMPAELVDPGLLVDVVPTTLHRLLGWRPNRTRFRHDADNPLPYDIVIIDEVSMVPLSMLSRILDAVPPKAHLVLVGDPDQLAAIEAGTVLGDLVSAAGGWELSDRVVTLKRGYRFDSVVQRFAAAVRNGDTEQALASLAVSPESIEDSRLSLIVPDRPGEWPTGEGALKGVRDLVTRSARVTVRHARAGQADQALHAALATKVLCAHRRGPEGVQVWNAAIEGWVHDVPAYRRPQWYPGRPIIITGNDYDLGVYNGDIGVAVHGTDGGLRVAVDGRPGPPIEHRRLDQVQTVHAMTVHKSQGSQFDRVIVVLPSERSPVLTRELLYTAVTRARRAVTIVGTPDALGDAIARPVSRASALPERLRQEG